MSSYKQVAKIESHFGDIGTVGVTINVSIERELSEKEASNIMWQHCDKIIQYLRMETLKNDPKTIKEVQGAKENLLLCFPERDRIYVQEIPNRYSSGYANPWYKVTTSKGVIIIGWRKRVINIDWSESEIEHDGNILFASEDVTKDKHMIHAWGYEKAHQYLHKLFQP